MTDLEKLAFNLQERIAPYFDQNELANLLTVHVDVWTASYYGCLMKAQANDEITLPGGLKMPSNSKYWTDLADKYKLLMPIEDYDNGSNGSGNLGGGYKTFMTRVDGQ